jgi:hypothetical protein
MILTLKEFRESFVSAVASTHDTYTALLDTAGRPDAKDSGKQEETRRWSPKRGHFTRVGYRDS